MNSSFTTILTEILIAGGGLIFIYLLGSIINTKTSGYTRIFYNLIHGLICFTSIYATVLTSGKTILTILLITFMIYIFRSRYPLQIPSLRINPKRVLECLGFILLFVLLFHLFPESEYKQQDSFFYLKISESLSAFGQENTSHYQNLLNNSFHGAEAYHFLELWLNNALLYIGQNILPGIYIFRIITFSIISVIIIYGLFALVEKFTGQKPHLLMKLMCTSFVFFIPDLSPYLSENIQRLIVFNFENNMLERPNFRMIYLFLLPVLIGLKNKDHGLQFSFFLICLSIVNPTVTIVTCPLFLLYLMYNKGHGIKIMDIIIFITFIFLYTLFYVLLGTKGIPPMYDFNLHDLSGYYSRSWKFVLLTTLTSLAYAAAIAGIFYLIVRKDNRSIQEYRNVFRFAVMFVVVSVVIARLGGYFENFYQVAFNGYIVTSLIILLLCLPIAQKSKLHSALFCGVFLSSFIFYKANTRPVDDVFRQNSRHAYSGRPYSEEYIEDVAACLKKEGPVYGAYMADSSYYRDFYYSARNPVVYHLPITYIVAAKINNNIDFCLSSKENILYDPNANLETNIYLSNALSRSWFHITSKGKDHITSARDFIRRYRLRYLFMTPGADMRVMTGLNIEKKLIDKNTGEIFYLITH